MGVPVVYEDDGLLEETVGDCHSVPKLPHGDIGVLAFDFQQKLLSMGDSVGVLAPVALKDIIRKKAETTANNNASAGMDSQYHFKVYKK